MPAGLKDLRYLIGTVPQTVADGLVIKQINLPSVAINVKSIDLVLHPPNVAGWAAAVIELYFSVQAAYVAPTGVVGYSHEGTIWSFRACGQRADFAPTTYSYFFQDGMIVTRPYLFITFDTTATGVLNVPNYRITYEEIKLSELESIQRAASMR